MDIKELVARFCEIAVELGVPPEKGAVAGLQCFNSMAKMSDQQNKEDDRFRRKAHLPVPFRPAADVALVVWLNSLPPADRDGAIRNNVRPYVPLYETEIDMQSSATSPAAKQPLPQMAKPASEEKPFEVGGVQFVAVRQTFPIPHWLARIEETGEVLQSGTAGISSKSVPKMIESLEELLARGSKGDVRDFRRGFGLPKDAPHSAVAAVPEAGLQTVVKEGAFSGPVLSNVDGVVTQRINRKGDTALHDRSKLSQAVGVGDLVDITYRNGSGNVKSAEKEVEVGR